MMNNRFMVDDAGTLIDIETRDTYDIVEEVCDLMNELNNENTILKEKYERKDRQLQRAKKDTRKYTDYFMNELNWDCDRIIEEVFR